MYRCQGIIQPPIGPERAQGWGRGPATEALLVGGTPCRVGERGGMAVARQKRIQPAVRAAAATSIGVRACSASE